MRNAAYRISRVGTGPGLSMFCAALVMMLTGATTDAADAFPPASAKGTLRVEYIYESSGTRTNKGMGDTRTWRVSRTASLVADLAAQVPTAMPTLQALDASQTAELEGMTKKAEKVARQMEPMMADVEKIIAKCGEDEDCITREAQKMGAAMAGTPKMDDAMKAKKDIEGLKPGSPRYQAWYATAQQGTYSVDETAHLSTSDPICHDRPGQRCTRDEVRKGAGAVVLPAEAKKGSRPAPGIGAVEVDAAAGTLTVRLPVPMMLPYTETITTDEPEGMYDTPTPAGPQQKLLRFRVNAEDGVMNEKPFTVPLKGTWRSQSGEQIVMLKGALGEAGKLTVRWRFDAR